MALSALTHIRQNTRRCSFMAKVSLTPDARTCQLIFVAQYAIMLPMEIPPSISVIQAARLLSVTRERILALIHGGRIEATKTGPGTAPWIVSRDSVLSYRPGKRGPGRKSKPLQTQDLRDFPETPAVCQ